MSEPRFRNVNSKDAEIENAHARAADTIHEFIAMVKEQNDVAYMAKLRFRDPDFSEETGVDQFLYLWLSGVYYHEDEKLLSGVFFEVPKELQEWHQVGQRLGFEYDDVFDWMVNDNGRVKGGYTIRVTRSRLATEQERKEFDEYSGITFYESL
ncbi:DUF2314 domain-containing protein [Aliikangiella sp. G2MR2-5]|uniref:DUF2314 domain-containing protein n=1 Tax=Aliikangiella sp. G2MR2-5 TaxID=2788943 RepID=UPI0018AA9654|nr:DUF2314 domain-containing protein [Aliikangiella sp. G2MR2-5]